MNVQLIESGLNHLLKSEGRLFTPITGDLREGYVYMPERGIHAHGHELHVITVYLDPTYATVNDLEMVCDNGYTLDKDEPFIARIIQQLND